VSLVRRAGHKLTADTMSSTECTVTGTRIDNGDTMSFTFTLEDAERAQLVRKGSAWEKYPASMLWVRAASQLIRMLFPDVLISMHNYDPDELAPPEPSVEAVAVSPSPVAPSDPSTETLIEWEPEDE
jgi:hypothetical protein